MEIPTMICRKLRDARAQLKTGAPATADTLEALELGVAWLEEYTGDIEAVGRKFIDAEAEER